MKKANVAVIFKIFSVIFALSTALLLTVGSIVMENQSAVNGFLNAQTQIVYEEEDGEERDSTYFKTEFNSVAEVIANGEALCEETVAEGAVLLKNEAGALPLASGSKISLFGAGSVNIVVGGGGSSSTGASYVDFKTAFEDPSVGLDVNDELWNWYASHPEYGRKMGSGIGARSTIGEAPWSVLPEAKNAAADAAVFIVTRVGSEDGDVHLNSGDNNDMTNGNYLALSPQERDVLANLKKLKGSAFDKIVVVLNTSNQVELDFADSEEFGIDSILWCGTLGSTGSRAVGDILVGNVNPSGRLSDTFWMQHRYNPVNANFGDYTFGGKMADGGDPSGLAIYDYGTTYRVGYVVYQEGVYVGYRYTETRYEDYVTGREKTGDYIYSDVVAYPFGYGTGYSTFAWSDFDCVYDAETDVYTISVKVTNTGGTDGKEVVQIYAQKPYTAYDETYGVEKPAVELVGFAKTDLLAADGKGSETVTITVPGEYLASYDSNGKGTYIAEAGDHFLTAARDAHEAANNILAAKGYTPETTDGKMTAEGNALMTEKITFAAGMDGFSFDSDGVDAEKYSVADTGADIVNRFDYADMNRYEHKGENSVAYVTRKDWNGTVTYGIGDNNAVLSNQVRLTLNAELESDLREEEYQEAPADDVAYPTYRSTETSYMLIDMRVRDGGGDDPENEEEIPYDDPMWDDLLDQLSWEDTVGLLSCGERMTSAIDSIAKMRTIDHNGAVGVNQTFNNNEGNNRGFAVQNNDPDKGKSPSAYPCNGIAAATFNTELMERYGKAWGEDALWAGYAGLYGPGLNMHRSPYAGRNFEYFSEDSMLAGKICSALSEAVQSKGIYVYLKHPLLNDQEAGRRTISTWANEQSIREIYLRPFEICIEEGGTRNIMTGLNKVGPTNNIFTGFVDDLLRGEFGMKGFAVTDYMHNAQSQVMPVAHLYGVDLPDRDYSQMNAYARYEKGHGALAWAMRESVHRILYTVVHSAAMNGVTSSTRVVSLTPDWQYWLKMGTQMSATLLAASAALLITVYAFPWAVDAATGRLRKDGGRPTSSGDGSVPPSSGGVKKDLPAQKRQEQTGGRQRPSGSMDAYMARKEPPYVWIIRAVISLALVAVLIAEMVVAASAVGSNHALIESLTAYNAGRVYEQNGGAGVKSNVFEAEELAFSGSIYQDGKDTGHACTAAAFRVGTYSGGIALGNLAAPADKAKNTLTLSFNSDKKARITMAVRVGTMDAETLFAEGYTVRANGKAPRNMEAAVVPAAAAAGSMAEVGLVIDIEPGANTVVFEAEEKAFLFDSVDLQTSAALTEFSGYAWESSGFALTAPPTDEEAGMLTVSDAHGSAVYDLPSIFDGVASGVYKAVRTGESVSVRLGSTSFEVGSKSAAAHTLTLGGDYVTFAGGEKTAQLTVFSRLPEMALSLPAGAELLGFYEAEDWTKVYDTDGFVMPDYDVELIPIVDDGIYAAAVSDELQQVCLLPASWDAITPIRIELGSGFDMVKLRDGMTKEAMIGNGAGAPGAVYNWSGTVGQGWSFVTMNACDYMERGVKSLVYVYQNMGSETVSFDIWQTSASSAPKAEGNPHKSITLEPGEFTRFVLSFSFQNGNLLTYYEFTSQTKDLKLASAQYIIRGAYDIQPDEDSVLTSLTYEGKYTSVYTENDTFDPSGLTVRADFSDGAAITLTPGDYTVSPERLTLDTKHVTLSYTHGGATKSLQLPVSVFKEGEGYHVTITGGAQFTDGNTETKVMPGSPMPAVELTGENAETGKKHLGWIVNEGGKISYVKTDDFVMPQADVTVTPYVVLGWEYGTQYGGGVLDFSENRNVYVDGQVNPYVQSFISHITVDSASITGRYVLNGERVGTVYSFSGDANEHFRIVRACAVRPANERTIKYTLKNVGDTDVSFTAYQVNSGTNIDGVPTSGSITIAAGEERTIEFTFAYNNANVMLLIRLDAAATNAQLWLSGEISD